MACSRICWALLPIPNLPFARFWAKLLLIPKQYLYAGISVFCGLGVYATSASVFDLLMVLGIGVLGFLPRPTFSKPLTR